MSKLRVLTISKPYVSGAYRQKLRYLAEDPRFEIGLICPKNWAGQDFEPHAKDSYWLKILDIRMNGKNHFHTYVGLEEAIREFRPDVINVEEEHYSLVTWQVMRIGRKLGAKILFYTWQNIDKSYPPPFAWIEQYVLKNAQVAVCGNQESLDILRRKKYRGEARIIPQMGADAETIALANRDRDSFRSEVLGRLRISGHPLLLVFAGRLVEEKGIQDVLKAMGQIKREGHSVHLLLLGNGPFRTQLEDIAKCEDVSTETHFLGSVSSLEVYRYIGLGDALVLASHTRSNWKEQFGRVLIEAMLSSTVPIGSDSGEIPLVIGEAGLVHKEGQPEDIARCLRSLIETPGLKERLAQLGVARASTLFTNRIIAQSFGDAFLLAAKR